MSRLSDLEYSLKAVADDIYNAVDNIREVASESEDINNLLNDFTQEMKQYHDKWNDFTIGLDNDDAQDVVECAMELYEMAIGRNKE